ncbi:Prolyl oligopeptidase [Beutenbergia cavernae DSM 12333]|uniref:Prolyl oligopeptidase n=1 Tax=Beutenbergia cavernae (strain ATCC BAA-8 / DSM 12333 / CCUG 43141 / JCM 11478 / NBRC 16432 / NCIMB 13614 / HKI 0122) TaxID=471853 RepID=C5C3M8_BEUC1|nr:prolyl oligopeptidase family serine peptidase [Beutenbergia cavernae]ACQ81937.1 Prolyl oligopeptidase [Beutenbergia cavernae DSM 12333]
MTSDAIETATGTPAPATAGDPAAADRYAWLEDVEGDDALGWVRERNAETDGSLAASDDFAATKAGILGVLDSTDKIPEVAKVGEHYYNFWRDADQERGIWRRTTLDSYRSDDPEWEVVLDVDALNETEGENWVWHGASVLRTGPLAFRRAIVDLSRGGADADVSREFDLGALAFVDGGFHRPEAKGGISWIDEDTLFVFTDFGPGTMTPSGYPRLAKRWRRGQDLADAELVYEGASEDMYIAAFHDRTPGFERDWVSRTIAFYDDELYLLGADGELTKVDVPNSAMAGVKREWLLVELREDWTLEGGDAVGPTFDAGSLLAIRFEDFLSGSRAFEVLVEPTPTTALVGATWTASHLVVNVLDDVKNRLEVLTPPSAASGAGGTWARTPFTAAPDFGTVEVSAVDDDELDQVWMVATDYLTPTTLSLVEIGPDGASRAEQLKHQPTFFDPDGRVIEQHFAASDDGTRVPYFVVRPADLAFDGTAPTLLYGYGGFEISLTPAYSGTLGRSWISRGGVYVVANIRGGGEYGPTWHQAALKEKRHKAYQDFAAVARDLVARGITSPARLGIQGGSNGGLLTGNMLTQYPELFGAVVVQVPLLDMKRYSHLLAGASWMAEYGDPDDDEQWAFLRTFSPYHLFDAERTYPPVLFTTSTRDDRVHPGHARKMAALMLAAGKDVTYWENVEGGHGGAATNAQAAHMAALAYRFLWERLA